MPCPWLASIVTAGGAVQVNEHTTIALSGIVGLAPELALSLLHDWEWSLNWWQAIWTDQAQAHAHWSSVGSSRTGCERRELHA